MRKYFSCFARVPVASLIIYMDIKEELQEAIGVVGNEQECFFIEGTEKELIVNSIKGTFVKGNPRAMWLSLKYNSEILEYNDGDINILQVHVDNYFGKDSFVYLLLDDDEHYLIKLRAKYIGTMIGECSFFEYCIVDLEYTILIEETDHNELILVQRI
jgi:hypothetical protein